MDHETPIAVTRVQSRFLERMPEFRREVSFGLSPEDTTVVGEPIGSVVPPPEVGRPPTIFGATGFATQGVPAVAYSRLRALAPIPRSKIVPDAVVETTDGAIVVVPVGTRGQGNSWMSFYVRTFLCRAIGLRRAAEAASGRAAAPPSA